jgi:MOSC domain-containing protein
MIATIAGLWVYPVKSCRGLRLSHASVTERGLAHDREWMIVDSAGRFISQREIPRLALIVPTLSQTSLELTAPGKSALCVPLDQGGETLSVTVWRDKLDAIDQGDAAAAWISAWIGCSARLVRFDSRSHRPCNPVYAGDTGAHTAFADGYPLLVLSEASLAELNRRLASPLPLNRFRPNIVLSAIEAYDEDHIDELAVAGVTLRLVKPCTRCEITTTDQSTAQRGAEPLATLGSYRMNEALGGVTFGVNAIVVSGAGREIRVGAAAEYSLRF